MGATQTPETVTVVMLPDGTYETADQVRTATMASSVFAALTSGSNEDRPLTPALKEYMEQHASYLDE